MIYGVCTKTHISMQIKSHHFFYTTYCFLYFTVLFLTKIKFVR